MWARAAASAGPFRINVSYRIGKMGFDGQRPRRKKSVSNDDLKDGGGDGMEGGTQQPQQRGNSGAMPVAAPAVAIKTADTAAKNETTKASADAVGTWTYTIETQQGSNIGSFVIKKEGDVYAGSTTNSRTNQETAFTTVSVNGNELTATYTSNMGGNEVPVTIKGTISGNEFDGTMSFGQFRTIPLKAKR